MFKFHQIGMLLILGLTSFQVALVNGIAMGGGAAMAVPLKFTVVTEKTVRITKILTW